MAGYETLHEQAKHVACFYLWPTYLLKSITRNYPFLPEYFHCIAIFLFDQISGLAGIEI